MNKPVYFLAGSTPFSETLGQDSIDLNTLASHVSGGICCEFSNRDKN
jgi:hypothetical protein